MRGKELGEQIAKILDANIKLHSIRQGEGVFSISSFEQIRIEIVTLVKASLPELAKKAGYMKLSPDQSLPEVLDCSDCPCPEDKECGQCFEYDGFNQAIKQGWRKVILEVKDGR